MKKYSVYIIAVLLLGVSFNAHAQTDRDVFRFSNLAPMGTARYSSLAGSMGAFGADFTTLSMNPAGIALYNRNEFTITPIWNQTKITSHFPTHNGEKEDIRKNSFNIGNLGLVFAGKIKNENSKWKTFQFGTGLNRLADYSSIYLIEGSNQKKTSYIDELVAMTNGTYLKDIVEGYSSGLSMWAYDNYLIDPVTYDNGNTSYFNPFKGLELDQSKEVETRGSLYEWVFSGGANYNDKLFIGATIGVPFFSYTESSLYQEVKSDKRDTVSAFTGLWCDEYFTSQATGVNLKLGLMYQPANFIRLAVAIHTPTLYENVRERYSQIWEGSVDSVNLQYEIEGSYSYTMKTPYRILGDISFLIKKRGFINIGYEMVDYTSMSMRSDKRENRDYFKEINKSIEETYRIAHILKIGAEVNLSPIALRAGYSYTTNPYSSKIDKDGSRHLISAGLGYRAKYFFLDLAYVYSRYADRDVLYSTANLKYRNAVEDHSVLATFGFRL